MTASNPPGVTVATVLRDLADSRQLDLELLAGGDGLGRHITVPHTQKTGLALSGFDAYLRHTFTVSGQLKVTSTRVVAVDVLSASRHARLFDQAISEQTSQRAVEVARQQQVAPQARFDLAHQGPPMAWLVHQSQQDFENQRFQRHGRSVVRLIVSV